MGGYVLYRFVKKGKSIFFTTDNINFMEDTAYDQNSFHRSLIVINQEETEDGEPINETFVIPEKTVACPHGSGLQGRAHYCP